MYLMLAADHPLAGRPRLRLADLADDEWILGSGDRCPDARILVHAFQQAGFEPRIGFHSDDCLAIQGFVAAGFGVSFIPDLALVTVRDDVLVRSLGERTRASRAGATLAGSWGRPSSMRCSSCSSGSLRSSKPNAGGLMRSVHHHRFGAADRPRTLSKGGARGSVRIVVGGAGAGVGSAQVGAVVAGGGA